MAKKFIFAMTLAVIALCLLSGGCAAPEKTSLQSIKDLLKIAPRAQVQDSGKTETVPSETATISEPGPSKEVKLYFADAGSNKLIEEDRNIEKTVGIARKTLQELVKGPDSTDKLAVFPEGTRLLDINIRADDSICVVDFSSEIKNISSEQKEKLMVYAIANTLGQFPSIKGVIFKIDGQNVERIKYMDLSQPVETNVKI